MKKNKRQILTFKADEDLANAIKAMPNSSEFIRSAILAALDSTCPFCGGTGSLTPNQKIHWKDFAARHPLRECEECHENYFACEDRAERMPGHEKYKGK